MISTISTVSSPAVREICNHLWQSTLLVLVVAVLALALRKNSARVRYWLWMAASVKFLVPFSLLIAAGSHFARPAQTKLTQTSAYVAIDAMSQPFSHASDGQVSDNLHDNRAETRGDDGAPLALWRAVPFGYVLVAVWLCGLMVVVARWGMQWRRIAVSIRDTEPLREGRVVETLRRVEQLAGIRRPIAVLSSAGSMEPGVFGVVRPVLLWPEAISLHLDDAHLEAVLAHEAAHVRRRDNLTSLLHMVVEAIFWFHPVVWWMQSQLVKERERACDEEVLLLCPPQAYAESILKVCELCIESPLTCVSGITGADLKCRVVQIMTAATARKLGVGARLLLVATGMIVVAAPLMLGQMRGARVVAAVKVAALVETRAMDIAARVASPVELESAAAPNSMIAPAALQEFQSSGTIALAQAAAPADAGPQPRSRVLGMVLTIDPEASEHAMMAPGTTVSPAPVYPAEAKAAGIQGQVELNATITSAGTVASITDVSGPQVLRQSAIDAVMQWQFKQPDNGKPVAGVTNIKFLFQLPSQLPGMPPVVGPAPPADEAAAGVKQYGGDVMAPLQIYKVEPEYTDLARTDKVQGTVTLSLVVDEQGVPQRVKVVRGLGDGLDEKAVDAVTRSRFRPGMENGKAVSVFLYYKADFALKDGFASLLEPTGPGPENHYGVLKDGKFHHFLTGIDLTIPDGYAFAGCGMSSGNGEQAYINSQSKPNLAVWMRPVVEPLEGLRAGVRAKMVSKPGERGADWKERPESVRELTFSGKPGISVVADYMENGKPWVEYLIWINTGKTHTQFYGQAAVEQLAVLEKNVDSLASSAVIP